MKRLFKIIAFIIVFVISTMLCINLVTKYSNKPYRVSAYIALNEELAVSSINFDKVTNIYIAFAYIDKDGKITLENQAIENEQQRKQEADEKSEKIQILRELYPNKQIAIAVGGYKADGFSDMANDEEKRENFFASVKEFIMDYDLNGIDIDWEFPVTGGNGTIKSRPEDKENFTLLMKGLRRRIDELIESSNKKYELTFAQASSDIGFENIELEKIEPLIDAMNLMAYDYTGTWSKITGHNSNLYKSVNNTSAVCTDDVIKKYEEIKFPLDKIVLGVPLYGYGWSGVNLGENNGLYEQAKKSMDEAITYKDLKEKYIDKDGFVRYWDESAKQPYLYNGDIFITYDDEESVSEKSTYIREKRLGGVMVWEISQDDNNELINKMAEILNRK